MLKTNKCEKTRRVLASISAAHKKSIPVGDENMMKALKMEEQPSKQAAQQDDAYNGHQQELGPEEQPRAWTSTPTRSLSPTRRPAGAGWLHRAGPSQRLVSLFAVMCLTLTSLCANPETDENYNEMLPETVVVPLSYSGPLSVPSALSQCEATSRVLSLSKRSCNEVLPENVVEPLSYSGPLSMPSALSQYEATTRVLSLCEPKYKKASQNERNYKENSQNEFKYKKVSLNETKYMKEMMLRKDFQIRDPWNPESSSSFCWECQQIQRNMDDDLTLCRGNNVGVRHASQCLSWEKCTVWPDACSHAKSQRTSANPQLTVHYTINCRPIKRSRSELSPCFSEYSSTILCTK